MSTSDEKARRAALRRYAVLDTPPEAPFDRIARLAARLFEAPIALVTLVDEDRQWFKAGVGFGQNETDIELSFCAHTIRDEGVMVVEDATEDERFADNPLVTGEPGIRFYAGAPLVTPDGYRIGSVCVIDTAPRTLDAPASLDALQDLADMAMDQMQRRVTHPHHTDVLESITDAFFALDDEWRFTYLNEQAEALLLRSRDELLGRNVWDEFPDAVELDFYEQYHRAVREGEHVQFEAYFPPLDTWFQINAYPFDGGLSVFFDDITARKKTEDTLRAREEYLAVTLRSIGDAVIATDAEGRVTEMNLIAERLTGWPLDEATGRPLGNIFHIENSKTGAPVENPVRNVLEEGQIVGLANHTMLTARDGTQYQIADSAAPIRTDDGELLGVVMVFRDVTDKYEQDEALRAERNLLAGVFDTSAAAITVVDASGQIIRVNERAEEVLGLGTSGVEGRPYDDLVWTHMTVDGSPLPDEELPFARVMASEAPVYDAQYAIEWPDGRRRILSINGAPLQDDDGTVTGAVFSLDDITDEHEQREALEAQRERLEMALIGGNIGMWDWDMQTDATVYDERWAAMLGYTLDEVEYENTFFERHTHPDDLERVYDDIERHAAGELSYLDQEIRMRHRDGSWRWVLDRGKIVERAEDGTPRRMVGTHVDITEKKRREEALRERTIALRQAQRVTKTGNGSIDLVEETIDLSEEAGRLLGLDPSVKQPVEAFMALVHPGDQELVQQEFERVAAGELHDETYRIIPAGSDTVRWLRGQGLPEADETGAVTRVFSTITDITEQRAREQALRESRQLLKESQRIAHLGHWDWNVETGVIHWSDETYRIFGYEPGAFDPTRATYFEAIPEPDRQRIEALNRQSIETGHMDSAEHRIVRPDGSERIVELSGVITEGGDEDRPTRIVGTVLDITERKEREEQLRRQRDLLGQTQRLAGAWEYDLTRDTISWSDEVARILEWPPDKPIRFEDMRTLFTPEGRPKLQAAIQAAIEEHEPYDLELPLVTPQGNRRWVRTVGVPTVQGGEVVKLAGALQDITIRKEQEQALRESKIALEQAQAIAQTGNGIWDLEAGTFTLSSEAARLLGLDADTEYPLDTLFELIHPDDQALMDAEFAALEAGEMHDAEYRVTPAGSDTIRWLRARGRPEVDEAGTTIRVFGIIADISERKAMEGRLRAQEQMYRELVQTTSAILWRGDPDTFAFTYISPQVKELLGYTPEEWTADPDFWVDHIHPDDRDWVPGYCADATEEMRRHSFDYRMVTPDGQTVWLRDIVNVVVEDGEPVELVGVMIDVTELKETEQALAYSLSEKQRILETTLDGYMLHDMDGTIVEVNPAYCEMVGYDRATLVGMDIRDLDVGLTQDALDQRINDYPEVEHYRFETQHVHRDGHRVDLDVTATLMKNDQGEHLVNAFIRDITARKEAENALRESEERWRTLVESHPEPIHITVDGHYAYVNPSGARLFGVAAPKELIGRSIFEFVADEAKDRIQARKEQLKRGEPTDPLEHTLIRPDGESRTVVARSVPITYKGQPAAQTVVRDVTEQRRAEEALRESEERYRTLVERSHDAIYIYRGARLLFVNQRAQELTGYTEDELLTMNVLDLVHPADRERVEQYAQRRDSGTAPNQYEARILRKDGSVRYADFSVQAITYQRERAGIGSIRDVTKRRVAEEALHESEQRFRALAEETTDLVTRHGPDGTYLYASPSAKDVLGYPADDLVGSSFQPLVHPDDLERVEAHIATAQQEGEKVQFEYRVRHAEGHYLWVETAGQHVPGDGGNATLIASTRSVEERKAAEQALVRRERRVEALYEAMRGLTEARTHEQVAEHILTLINDTLGYPISTIRYHTDAGTLVPVAVSDKSQAFMPDRPTYDLSEDSLAAQAFHRGETAYYDDVQAIELPYDLGAVRAAAYVPIGSHGTISVGSLYVGAIDEFDLKLIEILARNADGVIERVDREDALRTARDEAEEMNRLKSAFLANMSHEIRTPLTSIIGFSEVLGEQELGEASKFAHLIQRGGQRLLDTLNSVLDLSQLEAGSMRLAPKEINVTYEVKSAGSFFMPRAEQEDIDLRVHLPSDPVEAHLDATATQRILNNLLSNAVKFTPPGGRIDLRLEATPDHAILEVEDTGVGMDEDFLPHLFDAFRQESMGDARAYEGSGLGLAITQQLVDLMGGRIDVATEKGGGTRFTVRLPRRVPE